MVIDLREFGLKVPLLVRSDGEIVDGQLRRKAAQTFQLTEVPVMLLNFRQGR